jgi:hypothetical protein
MAVNDEFIGCKIIELDVEPRLPIVDGEIFQKEQKTIRSFSLKRMNFTFVDLNAQMFTFSECSK